jgi:ankyrin repeat protein
MTSNNIDFYKQLFKNKKNGTYRDIEQFYTLFNEKTIHNDSVLHITSKIGNFSLFNTIFELHINDINKVNDLNETPLFVAIKYNHSKIISFLIDNNADVNISNNSKETPLIASVMQDDFHTIKLLLENNADVNIQTIKKQSPLIESYKYLIRNSEKKINLNTFKLIFKSDNLQINEVDISKRNILMIACANNNIDIVKILLTHKNIDANITSDVANKKNAFIFASMNDNPLLLKLLLDFNKKFKTTKSIEFALENSIRFNNTNNVKFLLKYIKKITNINALIMNSLGKYQTKIFIYLMEHFKVDVNMVFQDNSLLMHAIIHYATPIMEYLLKRKELNINYQNDIGENALIVTTEFEMIDNIKLLLLHKDININITKTDGNSPLFYACKDGSIEIVKLLLNNPKININIQNNLKETPIIIALKYNKLDVVKLLMNLKDIIISNETRTMYIKIFKSMHNYKEINRNSISSLKSITQNENDTCYNMFKPYLDKRLQKIMIVLCRNNDFLKNNSINEFRHILGDEYMISNITPKMFQNIHITTNNSSSSSFKHKIIIECIEGNELNIIESYFMIHKNILKLNIDLFTINYLTGNEQIGQDVGGPRRQFFSNVMQQIAANYFIKMEGDLSDYTYILKHNITTKDLKFLSYFICFALINNLQFNFNIPYPYISMLLFTTSLKDKLLIYDNYLHYIMELKPSEQKVELLKCSYKDEYSSSDDEPTENSSIKYTLEKYNSNIKYNNMDFSCFDDPKKLALFLKKVYNLEAMKKMQKHIYIDKHFLNNNEFTVGILRNMLCKPKILIEDLQNYVFKNIQYELFESLLVNMTDEIYKIKLELLITDSFELANAPLNSNDFISRILQFWTGSYTISTINKYELELVEKTHYLPTASTCFNLLKLRNNYSSENELFKDLMKSLTMNKGAFGFA